MCVPGAQEEGPPALGLDPCSEPGFQTASAETLLGKWNLGTQLLGRKAVLYPLTPPPPQPRTLGRQPDLSTTAYLIEAAAL